MTTLKWTSLVKLLIITASFFSVFYIKTNHEPIYEVDFFTSTSRPSINDVVEKLPAGIGDEISDKSTSDNGTVGVQDGLDLTDVEKDTQSENTDNAHVTPDENKDNAVQYPEDNGVDTNKANSGAAANEDKTSGSNDDINKGSGNNSNNSNNKKPNNSNQIPDRGGNNTEKPSNPNASYNSIVLDIIKTYDGRYPYLLNEDYANYNGVTENIYYQGQLFLKAHPSGKKYSHCSGITFEVFYKAMEQWNTNHGITGDNIKNLSYWDLQDFMLTWYVANGPKYESNLAVALEKYGLGKSIDNLEDAKAGDFLDFSRENNTGHTAVFLGWVKEDGRIVGFKYWSSQDSTGGIAYKTEYFNVPRSDGTKYGNVMIDNIYIGRVTP